MFTGSVTSASCSGTVVMQSYQCSLFFITFCNFLNKMHDIAGPTKRSKADAKLGFVNRLMANRRIFMESINAD
jgi:hypothetical protein